MKPAPKPRQKREARKLMRRELVDSLAAAAWSALNHDNDPNDGAVNAHSWRVLCEKIEAVLKKSKP